jgi:hypothetical protein
MEPAMNPWSTCLSASDVADLPLLWSGDVIVAGGGSAGCAATVAAARSGARTLVVERSGFLGGTGASVLDTFYGFYAPGAEGVRVVGGVAWEVADQLLREGFAFERPNTYGAGTGVTYEPDQLRRTWDHLVGDSGADVLLHSPVTRVVLEDDAVVGLVVETSRGPGLLRARAFVDASGDAEVAWRAGVALERPAPGLRLQPLTATFRMMDVEVGATTTKELHRLIGKAADEGAYRLPRREGSIHRTMLPGVVHTNLTRVSGVDPTDPFELSAAETEGRRQVHEYARFLVDRVPGYEKASLVSTADRIGVRESRRLLGRYVLTREDVMSARDFDDAIARCGAPLEDHDGGGSTVWEYIGGDTPSGETYGVPYRSLLPVEVEGLLVAGRCLSATHDAHASVRSMAQCMAMGEAAGTAAAMSVASDVTPGSLDAGALRARLVKNGVLL